MQVDCPQCGHVLEFSGQRPVFCGYCGKPLPSQEATAPFDPDATRPAAVRPGGQVVEAPLSVGSYRLLRALGGGGMGTVYEAEEMTSGRHVAVKLIAPEYATSEDALERFRQEGRLASLIAHPRCVFVLGADEEGGRPYIVMELMAGTTLQTLADRRGHLPPAEAVAKILDVIEGLQEAHRLGVIHRDVKPSNCFLLPDGRVKVGDFGLAKSLLGGTNLTRSGTFLGTLLYAPPEQIKGEEIDFRTDVYSVTATLYHLLTGQAPFHGKDAAATLARTVSEPPPPPRSIRPELPRRLERVVLRGLARDPGDRWRDLEELRQALLPFAPGQVTPAGPGARFGAFVIDFFVLLPLWGLVLFLAVSPWLSFEEPPVAINLVMGLIQLLPLALLEGLWGWSPGKLLLRLRVCRLDSADPPGLARGLWRTFVFYCLVTVPPNAVALLWTQPYSMSVALVSGALEVLGFVAAVSTFRARNGYRCVHDLASGTRVVRLPWPEKRPSYRRRRSRPEQEAPPLPGELPQRLGPFVLRGTLRRDGVETLLAAEDTGLGRQVWVRLCESSAAALPGRRRELSRATRLPWLRGGVDEGLVWDAFLAPGGCPLFELVEPRAPLTWSQVRPLLMQLSEELTAACADGSLPRPLTVAQVWVQPGGRLQLLDSPLPAPDEFVADCPGEDDTARAMTLLRRVAVLGLEGRLRPRSQREPVHAPLPGEASGVLDRLMGVERAYASIEPLQADLIALQGQPTEVNLAMRSAHLAMLLAVLTPLVLMMFGARYIVMNGLLQDLYERVAVLKTAATHLDDPKLRDALFVQLGADETAREMLSPRARQAVRLQHLRDKERLHGLLQSMQWDWPARLMLPHPTRAGESGLADLPSFGPAEMRAALAFTDPLRPSPWEMQWPVALAAIVLPAVACVLWAFCTRGGFTFRIIGLSLRRYNGRPAWRIQCAWRALLFWVPVVILLAASVWILGAAPERAALSFWLWCSAGGVLLAYTLLALWFPTRSLHDRLAGTYLAPR